jgi:hypothetical protein
MHILAHPLRSLVRLGHLEMSVASTFLLFLALVSLVQGLFNRPQFARDTIRASSLLQAGANIAARDDVPAGYVAAPYYPTPPGGWVSNWTAAYSKAQVVVANTTLAEKVNLTSGTGELMGPCVGNTGSALRFGIPNLCLQDSALGVADTDSTTNPATHLPLVSGFTC